MSEMKFIKTDQGPHVGILIIDRFITKTVPSSEALVVRGDFNTKVDRYRKTVRHTGCRSTVTANHVKRRSPHLCMI